MCPIRWPPACKVSAREMAALVHDALCTARVIIPGRDPAWIRRDGRMATKTAHRSCLSWPSQVWSMMTGQQLCFFSGTKAVFSLWGRCRETGGMPLHNAYGKLPLAQSCLRRPGRSVAFGPAMPVHTETLFPLPAKALWQCPPCTATRRRKGPEYLKGRTD